MTSFVTNDLSLTAYMVMHGEKLLAAQKFGRTYRFELVVSDQTEKLKLAFISSESARFDAAVRNVKKMLFGTPD